MTRRRRRKGMSAFTAGAIGIVVLVVITYLVFTKFANPFANQFTVHATFSSANGFQVVSSATGGGGNATTINYGTVDTGLVSESGLAGGFGNATVVNYGRVNGGVLAERPSRRLTDARPRQQVLAAPCSRSPSSRWPLS